MSRFREWTLARRSRFLAVTSIYTILVIAIFVLAGVDPRALGGVLFVAVLFAVVVNIQQGHRWNGH